MKNYKQLSREEFADACKAMDDRIGQIAPVAERWAIKDGAFVPEKYYDAPLKIMWMLKEAYCDEGGWRMQDLIPSKDFLDDCGKKLPTWRKVMYTTCGILSPGEWTWQQIPDIHDSEQGEFGPREALKCIAVVNVKKIPGESTSVDGEIAQAYHDNRDILRDQFTLYDPDVVIFGGTLRYADRSDFPGLESATKTVSDFNHHYYDAGDKLYVDAHHPAVRHGGDEGYVMDIVDNVRQWRKKIALAPCFGAMCG